MRPALIAGAFLCVGSLAAAVAAPRPVPHLRVNLAGYSPEDRKVVVLFAETPVRGWFTVRSASAPEPVIRTRVPPASIGAWGRPLERPRARRVRGGGRGRLGAVLGGRPGAP